MNTKGRPTISIPTFLTEAFRTAALTSENGERVWLEAEEAAGQHVESVFSAGCLTEDALNLFAPIQKSTHPITIYSLSPHYTPSVIRQLCIFQAPVSTTVLRSVGEESHIYLIDTEETPHVLLANSPIFTRENDFDAPRYIQSQAVDALSRGDIEEAKGLLIDRTTRYMNPRFHREIEEDNWEYSAWTRWKRVASRYEPISSIAALSIPSASYKIATSRVPSSYLAPPCMVHKQRSDPERVGLEGYYQTMLWCELANYFNL